MKHFAVRIGQNLKLDVPRLLDVLFNVNRAVTERLFGFTACDVIFLGEGYVIVRDTHAASTATSDGLDDDRVANLAGDLDGLSFGLDRTIRAGDDGHPGLANRVLRDRL